MKAWIVGDSFGTPCLTTDIFPSDTQLPTDDIVQGTEWVKQVVANIGYEYSPEYNFSMIGCCNQYILHNIDWVLHNDAFDKEKDLLVIVPTATTRFMYRSANRAINKNIFKFSENRTPHLNTAGSHSSGEPVVDTFSTMFRDHEFEYYRTVSTYDKTLSFLSTFNIDYLFCNAFWCTPEYGDSITGYKPQFINFDFPKYEIGFNADNQAHGEDVTGYYSNHFTHIGNDAYAKAVLDYIHERS
jgi:hypothetical protein|tara:strand:+ start:1774 stop:2499 length:726 start_codon:yes stop_codon:yes gene_type:complete